MFPQHGSTADAESKLESPKPETMPAELLFDEMYTDADFEIRLCDLPPG